MDKETKKYIDLKFDTFDQKINSHSEEVDKRFDELTHIISKSFTSLEEKLDNKFTKIDNKIDYLKRDIHGERIRIDRLEDKVFG